MLKKVGIVTAAAAAAALTFGGIAFAHDDSDDGHSHDHVYTHKVQECNQDKAEGVLQFPRDSGSSNDDSHDGDCDQDNYPDDSDD